VALASSTDETNMSSTRIKSHSIFKKWLHTVGHLF
jgi:hypothetical protein